MNRINCLGCLHFGQAETEKNEVTVFCGLATDGICCYATNHKAPTIVFGATEEEDTVLIARLERKQRQITKLHKKINSLKLQLAEGKEAARGARVNYAAGTQHLDSLIREREKEIEKYLKENKRNNDWWGQNRMIKDLKARLTEAGELKNPPWQILRCGICEKEIMPGNICRSCVMKHDAPELHDVVNAARAVLRLLKDDVEPDDSVGSLVTALSELDKVTA